MNLRFKDLQFKDLQFKDLRFTIYWGNWTFLHLKTSRQEDKKARIREGNFVKKSGNRIKNA